MVAGGSAIRKQITLARKALYSMLVNTNKLKLLVEIQCGIFDNLVTPVLLYGCEIWGHSELNTIELFHRKCLKHILKVNKSTANAIIYGETGRYKMDLPINKRIISFWNCLKNDKGKIANMIFKFTKKVFNQNLSLKSKWLLKVKSILITCGMPYLWDMGYIPTPSLKTVIDNRLRDTLIQEWHCMLENNKLCLNYKLFKETYEIEHYLKISDDRIRYSLSRFRSGSHFLPISNQRYRIIDERNNCPLCDMNELGDEYHYLMLCPAFDIQRSKYIDLYYTSRPNVLKYKELFTVVNISKLSKLSKFVNEIMFTFRP